MWILIPSYEPDERLVEIVAALQGLAPVLIVDDGSGASYGEVFTVAEGYGAMLVRHDANRGKAAALRTGFAWLREHAPGHDVVCADSDGQHRPEDIRRVAQELALRRRLGARDAVVLGARAFEGQVPVRSRLGNRITSSLVAAMTGASLTDTQTGLRGYPAALLPWALSVNGERFSYELRLLLDAGRRDIPVVELPIATVYLDNNRGSHFRPLRDSVQVLWPLAAFGASSLAAFAFDTGVLLLAESLGLGLALSLVVARTSSALLNFSINRRLVFRSEGSPVRQLLRYLVVAIAVLAAGYVSLRALTAAGMPLLPAKVLTDAALWFGSFTAQRVLVFGSRGMRAEQAPGRDLQPVA